MQNAFIIFVLATFTLPALAQKGTIYLGGSAGISVTDSKETGGIYETSGKNTSWSFSPEIGIFIKDDIQAGIGFYYGNSKSESRGFGIITPNVNKNRSFGGTVYTRKFWGKEAFKPFVGLNFMANTGKTTSEYGSSTNEYMTNQFSIKINTGFGYTLSKRVTAMGSFGFLGYNSTITKQKDSNLKNKNSSFGIDASSTGDRFNIGFYYTFQK